MDMMYKHMIDECIDRANQELATLQKYHRQEEADHVRRRLDSLHRLRKDAPVASRVPVEEPEPVKLTLEEILADLMEEVERRNTE